MTTGSPERHRSLPDAAHVAHEVHEAVAVADLIVVPADDFHHAADDARELSHKLLFGTDAPNTTLSALACLAHIDSFGLTPAARAAITGGNATRLIDAINS